MYTRQHCGFPAPCLASRSPQLAVWAVLSCVASVTLAALGLRPPQPSPLCSRCSILACSAYVALALGDNLMALNHADKLLQQPKLSGSLK